MVRILILDTETNGLPLARQAPAAQWQLYPAILQLSWAIYTADTGGLQEVAHRDVRLALHPSVPWNAEAAAIHGMSEEQCRTGASAQEALLELAEALRQTDVVLAHNLAFDRSVIRAAAYAEADRGGPAALRQIWPNQVGEFCTMQALRDIMQLSTTRPGFWKSPRLNEVHTWLFGHAYDISGAILHTASSDTHCLMRCVSELLRRGIFRISGQRLVVPATTTTGTTHG
jgi:DNA polymerase III epsilon subunit-like protein